MALLEVKLRPTGPWRIGHRSGDRERVGAIYHSDLVFSAVTQAMGTLGHLDEWLDATARANGIPAVRFSSLFPFAGNTRLVTPPKTSWPPAAQSRLYLRGAKLVPLEVALGSASGLAFDENRYAVDGESGCLIPGGASAPFTVSVRSNVAVDRVTGTASEAHKTACLEFHPKAGFWGLLDIQDAAWESRVKAAFRLLADSGFGGERSRGWGRAAEPEFIGAEKLFPAVEVAGAWWLLSMFSPDETDAVDWSRGEYSMETRAGWTDSRAGQAKKKLVRMVEEGSVLAAGSLRGMAVDVAPNGFAHPVYRCGFALAIPIALNGLQVVEPVVPEVVKAPIVMPVEEEEDPLMIAAEFSAVEPAGEPPIDVPDEQEPPSEEPVPVRDPIVEDPEEEEPTVREPEDPDVSVPEIKEPESAEAKVIA